jgi:hypothetical protein
MRNDTKFLVGKTERKRLLGRRRRRWEDNIISDLREMVWEGLEWMQVVHDMDQLQILVKAIMDLQVS